MKVRLYLTLAILLGTLAMNAQDIHFSQFYASPLTLNPALTGNFNGFVRLTGIYRNQFGGLTQNKPAFSTPSLGVDFSLLKEKIKHGGLGVGLVFVNDQQNGKTFNSNHILVSVAYNMGFGPKNKFQLGLGLQGGVIMNKINPKGLMFEEGFNDPSNPTAYDVSYDPGLITKSKMKGQFNIGLFAKYEFIKSARFYAGYALINVTRYKQAYVANDPFRTPFRHTVHGGFEFDIKDKAVLIPGFLYQNQATANETAFGLTVGIHVVKNPDPIKRATLFLGLWDRMNKSNFTLIPKIGFEYMNFRAGFAYDASLAKQRADSRNIGGKYPSAFEISLSYIGNLFTPKEDNYLFNPRY